MTNAYQRYTQGNIATEDPQKLIILLYDGIIRFLNLAKVDIENKDYMAANYHFIKARSIITELLSALDLEKGGEIAKNLYALYWFLFEKIVEANMKKDIDTIDEIMPVIKTLKSAWENVSIDMDEKIKYKGSNQGLNLKG